jgi:uncharacterized membrane protein
LTAPEALLLAAPVQDRRKDAAGWIMASVVTQVMLGLFLGHAYDMTIFAATGFLVGTGQNPYVARDLSGVFHSSAFTGLTSIGYPPPWPLLLGGIYRVSYALLPNPLLYRLAIKLPVIASNAALALAVERLCASGGASGRDAHRAFLLMLFNPLLLYSTAAWGQFDSVVALVCLLALVLLLGKRLFLSAVVLALGISLKPVALPLLPVSVLFAARGSTRGAVGYAALCAACLALFSGAPFPLLGWSPQVILRGWDAHVSVAGGLTWLTFLELATGTYALSPALRFLGFLWLPALLAGAVLIRPTGGNRGDLLVVSLRLTLLFFLTRSWLSEPNVVMILPLAAVAWATGCLDRRLFHLLWICPLVFTLFNASVPQVLAPSWPAAMEVMARVDEKARAARLVLRCASVVPWLVIGWMVVGGHRTALAPKREE